jgi:hypothetical protein
VSSYLDLHLRSYDVYGKPFRVVSLRPTTGARFSTNYFHDTWHILAGVDGARVLAQLVWGLSYAREPGTVVVIDGDHLCPTPFEADAPDPILIAKDQLACLDIDVLRALRLQLRRSPQKPVTIRWQTFSLDTAEVDVTLWRRRHRAMRLRDRMSRRAGFVCMTAPAALLRAHALGFHHMGGDDYDYLGDRWPPEGELQTIPQFDDKVSAATVARREILGKARHIADYEQRVAIWIRRDDTLSRGRSRRADGRARRRARRASASHRPA